ncbi:MAG: RNA-dependent RNA polymerase [Bactrocera dorsalis partiti-like virus 2 isolate Bf]|nr:MAG: RNA-dependent RNA polymerase [Bactrocera dorsalis partiti-like virus 2 isolate Bf]
MAFIKLDITTDSTGESLYKIRNPVYSSRPKIDPSPGIPEKHLLPKGKGFSFNMDPPFCDFKVLRAMCNAGFKSEAERIIYSTRRSYITPEAIWCGLTNYTAPTTRRLDDATYHQVLREARSQFLTPLKPISLREAAGLIPQSTSPGLPYLHTHPGMKKGEVLATELPRIKRYWDAVGSGSFTLPPHDCAAFARSHIGSADTNKVRPVWAYPLDVVCAEARFAHPYTDALKEQTIGRNTAYGMEMMCGGMTWLDNQLRHARLIDPGCKFLMTDYSQFDSTVPAWLIRDCFAIIWECFKGHCTREDYYIFKKLVSYFINTTIRNPDGRRLRKLHGVPSGSMFTNIIDTMVNFIVTRYIIKTICQSDVMTDVYFGDDAIVVLRSSTLINIDLLSQAAAYYFGMKINTKKSYWTNNINNVHFLGYYNSHGDAFKPSAELFASLLYPQYWVDDWKYTLARTMGTLMAAGGNNTDVFIVSQMIFLLAASRNTVFEDAQKLIVNNPRMRRHFSTMGVQPEEINCSMFMSQQNSIPLLKCTKIIKNIKII